MKPSYILFLKRLYGDQFNREFGRDGKTVYFKRVPVNSLEKLVKLSNLYQDKRCNVYASVYSYTASIPDKKPAPGYVYPYTESAIIDRIFIDFDKDLTERAKKEYDNLISISSKQEFYQRLIEQGQAKAPINEAKKVHKYIKDNFGGDPTLIFSGAKGSHVYIHFEPIKLNNPKNTIVHFVNTLEKVLNLNYMDGAVKGDFSRVSRIPTTQHPKTSLYVHPYKANYTYNEIIENSKNRNIPFDGLNLEAARSNISNILHQIDLYFEKEKERLKYEQMFKKHVFKSKAKPKIITINWYIMDRIYPTLYETGFKTGNRWIVKCPFHDDTHPSAVYNKFGFHCSTCNISVGVYRFLTEFAGYTKEEALNLIKQHQ